MSKSKEKLEQLKKAYKENSEVLSTLKVLRNEMEERYYTQINRLDKDLNSISLSDSEKQDIADMRSSEIKYYMSMDEDFEHDISKINKEMNDLETQIYDLNKQIENEDTEKDDTENDDPENTNSAS